MSISTSHKQQPRNPWLFIVNIFCICLLLFDILFSWKVGHDLFFALNTIEIPQKEIIHEDVVRYVQATRIEINSIVQELFLTGRSESVYNFYDRYTKDREVTYIVVGTALIKQIPINLLFGLIQWESNFNRYAVNENRSSVDRGLMQLNNLSFPNLTKDSFFDPAVNIDIGTSYFVLKYQQRGTWEEALMRYNGGEVNILTPTTIKHLVNVLEYEREFNRSFMSFYSVLK